MRDLGLLTSVRGRRSVFSAGVLLVGAMMLVGCGGSTPDTAGPPATAGPVATTAAAAPSSTAKTPIGKRTGDCGDAKVAVNVVINAASDVTDDVTSIDADPTCTELILSTDLTRTATAQGLNLCQAVAPAAFANGFSTVTIRVVGQAHVAAGNFVRAVDGGPCTTV